MSDFLHLVYNWYIKNQRNLPWRETSDPYKIWVSEIILQQTRVEQGTSYYQRFTERFPTVHDLAGATEEDVLKFWQGLGYYSRARNMHAAAKTICNKFNGIFPSSYSGIHSLKGIGPYTAAAIASIAFNLPYPALDGNIFRLLSRYFGVFNPANTSEGKKKFQKIAGEIMNENNPGMHNQALMEFGALQCIPKSPDCSVCPLKSSCYAFLHNSVGSLPAKKPKVKQRTRFFCYYYFDFEGTTWLEKRTGNDIWQNLYQFPLLETASELSEKEILNLTPPFIDGQGFNIKSVSSPLKHILSHQILFARLIHVEIEKSTLLSGNLIPVSEEDFPNYAIPRLIELLVEKTEIF